MGYRFIYNDIAIPYNIIFSRRRKKLALSIDRKDGIIIRAPYAMSYKVIHDIIEEKKEWIYHTLCKYNIVLEKRECLDSIQYLGVMHSLSIQYSHRLSIARSGTTFTIRSPSLTREYIRTALKQWLRKQAYNIYSTLYRECFSHFLPLYTKISSENNSWCGRVYTSRDVIPEITLCIRSMKRRYGSLHQNGKLTLNTSLIHSYPECIAFVIYHELAHIIEFNHSKAFYRILTSLCPQWKEYEAWLRYELHPL